MVDTARLQVLPATFQRYCRPDQVRLGAFGATHFASLVLQHWPAIQCQPPLRPLTHTPANTPPHTNQHPVLSTFCTELTGITQDM